MTKEKIIKIGTRSSPLAMWQAELVAQKLQNLGHKTQIIPIVSHGDKNLTLPIYKLGIVGVFTKDLDIALLNNQVDIAVHSLKDIPTTLPENIHIAAVLERDFPEDVLVRNPKSTHKNFDHLHIATGSLRRQSYWKNTFKNCTFSDIRGNIQTRLQKLESENFDGVIFSLAGLKRMEMNIQYEILDFITPAPAQGVVAVTSLIDNDKISTILNQIDHKETERITQIEREFLQVLEGGCSAPIGAHVSKIKNDFWFKSGIVNLEGTVKIEIEEKINLNEKYLGKRFAEKLKSLGADKILNDIKNNI